jgi:hypothetical protein
MLSKQNFPLFVIGPIAVILVRGGWRHWRGLLVFALVALAVSLTWYWSELTRTLDLIHGSSSTPSGGASGTAGGAQPDRYTLKNAAWYVWSTLNVTVLAPLALASVGGAIALSVRWLRRRASADPTPELVAGAVVAYLGVTYIALKDPRYFLPSLPYLAVLGAGWISLVRGRWRAVAVAAVSAVALLNVAGTFLDHGNQIRITLLPNSPHSGLGERQATLYSPGGWISGAPERKDAIVATMVAAREDPSIDAIVFDPGAAQSNFNHPGLDIRSREAGIPIAIPFNPEDSRQVVISQRNPPLPGVRPCAVKSDGTGIYLNRGPLADRPYEQREFYRPPRCPGP